MVTIASDAELSADPKVKQAFFIVQPSGDQLTHISELFESGKLRTAVKTVLPFEEAEKAYKKPTPGFGKVVLRLPSSSITPPKGGSRKCTLRGSSIARAPVLLPQLLNSTEDIC